MLDFTFEFHNEIETIGTEQEFALYRETQLRLRQLAEGHNDLTGAAVTLEPIGGSPTAPNLYQCRIALYARPENLAATSKEEKPTTAVKRAMEAIERQVREKRERLRERSREATAIGANEGLYELTAQEIYATYAENGTPKEWLAQPRAQIATQLMMEEELNQGDAFYAADQILVAAEERVERADAQAQAS
ncbi:MAG TPA: hypothetical protein P5121_07325 [Caldilineaceae bacterium]|nr:hypothetical protein [Caldilineaceae bacterium]